MRSITLCHMYPELLNLYGDKGNAAVLKLRSEKRNTEFNIKTVCAGDSVDLSDVDIVLFGGGSANGVAAVKKEKDKYAPALKEYAERGGVVLALCEGISILADAGVVDIEEKADVKRKVGDTLVEARLGGKNVQIAGFENHMTMLDIKNNEPLGQVVFGDGNDGVNEGAVYKNVIMSHLFGPVLPKNPELADYIIKTALDNKYGDDNFLCELDDSVEMLAKEHIIKNCRR